MRYCNSDYDVCYHDLRVVSDYREFDLYRKKLPGRQVKAPENIFNISSGVSMSLNDLTQLISDTVFELFNKSPVVKFLGNDSDINPELIISNSKLNAGKYLEYANVHHEIKELLLSCDRWFVCNK